MNQEETRNLSYGELLYKFLKYLEDKSYTQLTLVNYRRTLRKIELFMTEHGIDADTPEIGMQYYETYIVENVLENARQKAIFTAIRRLNDFNPARNIKFSRKIKFIYCPVVTSMHWAFMP